MVNVKLAFRTLARTPLVTAVAILSLGLGIGANTAIFSMFDELLLRPLPVPEADRLVNLSAPGPKPGSQSCGLAGDCEYVFSYPMLRDLQAAQTPFTGIAAHMLFGANTAFRGQTLNGEGVLVSGSYFAVLRLNPALGRLLQPADDETVGAHFVTVLSYNFWQNRLGSDSTVLGETMVVNGQPMTIVGVAPEGFGGTSLGARPDVFVPITMRGLVNPGFTGFENRRSYWAYAFARLKPGVTIEEASVAMNSVYRPIVNDVEAPLQTGMSDQQMERFRAKQLVLEEGRRGQSAVHGDARTPVIILFVVTGVVLLIACANVANLLLARAASRSMELAIRLSLGSSRGRVLAQLLTESVILSVLGGIASIVIAYWTLGLVASLMPADIASTMPFSLSWRVIGFAAAISIGTGLLFGLFPALHGTRPDLMTALRANSGQPSGARAASRFRYGLVTAQIALSMALLIPAGLFIKSLANVSRVDLGLNADDVVTFGVSPQLNGYDGPRSSALFSRMEEELGALPGVTAVTASRVAILAGNNWGSDVQVEGFQADADTDTNARTNEIGTGYFAALGIPLLAGREFTLADRAGSPTVVIVNEAFVKKFNLGNEAVGKRMGFRGSSEMNMEIVGVVRDAKYSEVKDQIPPMFFQPYRQNADLGNLNFYVRTGTAPEPVIRAIPTLVGGLDPDLPVQGLKTLPQQVRDNVFLDRMISTLAAAFAILATLLAAVGLYGVLAHVVAQRTREIGVRMALGADARRVRMMVLRQVALMTLIGGVIGIAAAIALGRLAQSLLFELEGHDPLVVAASVVMLTAVALGAGYIPALRASKVDPMQALRYE
jgi:predicted permease